MVTKPGGFRTSFLSNNIKADVGVTKDYRGKGSKWMGVVDAADWDPGMVNGDPKLFGRRILEAAERTGVFRHLAGTKVSQATAISVEIRLSPLVKEIQADHEKMTTIVKSTDINVRQKVDTSIQRVAC